MKLIQLIKEGIESIYTNFEISLIIAIDMFKLFNSWKISTQRSSMVL